MSSTVSRFQAFDLLATPVAVIEGEGRISFVNAALEDVMGMSRRNLRGMYLPDFFADPQSLKNALLGACSNEFAAVAV